MAIWTRLEVEAFVLQALESYEQRRADGVARDPAFEAALREVCDVLDEDESASRLAVMRARRAESPAPPCRGEGD